MLADAGRLEQVLDKLLSNAVKYSLAGGAIEVMLRPKADGAILVVKDTGIGLPMEEAARSIFEPFGRAANATVGARHVSAKVCARAPWAWPRPKRARRQG